MNQKFIAKSNYLLRKVLNSENNLDILQDFVEAILNVNIQKMKMGKKLIKQNNMNVYNPPMKNNIAYHISFYSGTLPSKKYLSA